MRTHTKEATWIHNPACDTTSSTLCRMPHLNKQNKNINPIIRWHDYHLTQPCPSEENQQQKIKLSINLILYKADTNHYTNLRGSETKRKKEFNLKAWEKETSNTKSLRKTMKMQKSTAQMKEKKQKHRNPKKWRGNRQKKKEFRITIVKIIKNLENRMEKMQQSINKDRRIK